jgi:hypothetical protein
MRTLPRFPIALAAIATLGFGGNVAFAESPGANPLNDFQIPEVCQPWDELCPDPNPDPDPDPDPNFPGPDELTDDPCDPVEGPCGGGGEDPDPEPEPQPEPCQLDEVCERTPTFTG